MLYNSMEEAKEKCPKEDNQRIAIANYEGKFIVTGKEGECEGCQEDAMLRFFDGMWFCAKCIVVSLNEESEGGHWEFSRF